MTKAIVKMKCKEPNCTHPHDIEVDLPEPNVIEGTISTPQILTPATTAPPVPVVQEEKPRKLKHEELEELIPEPVNFVSCPGNDCGHKKLENPKKTTKFVECPNCSDNSNKKNAKFCKTCGKGPKEDEEDYWGDSSIELEE